MERRWDCFGLWNSSVDEDLAVKYFRPRKSKKAESRKKFWLWAIGIISLIAFVAEVAAFVVLNEKDIKVQNHMQSRTTQVSEETETWVQVEAGDYSLCLAVVKDYICDPGNQESLDSFVNRVREKNKLRLTKISKGDKFFIPIKFNEVALIEKLQNDPVVYTPPEVSYEF